MRAAVVLVSMLVVAAAAGAAPAGNRALPTLTIRGFLSLENAGHGLPANLAVVNLSALSRQAVTVKYATVDGTAKAPDDYVRTSGTVRIKPGNNQAYVLLTLANDSKPEPKEAFRVVLSNPGNATIADGSATITIIDNDYAVRGSVEERWQPTAAWTGVLQLDVHGASRGTRIEIQCSGNGCPFARKTAVYLTIPLAFAQLFEDAKLRPGTVLEVRMTRPSRIGRVLRYTMRAGHAPSTRKLCLPPGSKKPSPCA